MADSTGKTPWRTFPRTTCVQWKPLHDALRDTLLDHGRSLPVFHYDSLGEYLISYIVNACDVASKYQYANNNNNNLE